jgi:hypothetical protein
MGRRLIDGLIVLWGITACLLFVRGKDLFAAPGDCDKECREVLTQGSDQGGGKTGCKRWKHDECTTCVDAGGCWKDLPVKGGKCEVDETTTQEEATNFTCAILCNNPQQVVFYEAHTNVQNFQYKEGVFRKKCNPKQDED